MDKIKKSNLDANASQSYTLPSRAKNQPHKPKLVNKYACPSPRADRESVQIEREND